MAEELRPLVLISYSHDSPELKRWVSDLATRLMDKGVDILLDQWEVSLGDDLPKFMERSVRQSHRVLMICTEPYVRKANDGIGGVGYESMIVTGELVRDLGTTKFIPVIRQAPGQPPCLPTCVSTRLYVDFSDDAQFEIQFEHLLRELHNAPVAIKPKLGPNPFARNLSSSASPMIPAISDAADWQPSIFYDNARQMIRLQDMTGWRKLVTKARLHAKNGLASWWEQYGNSIHSAPDKLSEQTLEGIDFFQPLIALALAGVGSGDPKFSNQIALFEDVTLPAGWNQGGYVIRVELPHAGGFIYQGIHGALCLHTTQLEMAINLVRERVRESNRGISEPIYNVPTYMGWVDSLGRDSGGCWKILSTMLDRWPWLIEVFGSVEDYVRALVGYHMALVVNEYACRLAANGESNFENPENVRIGVPTHFAATKPDIRRAAYRLLTADPRAVCEIWRSLQVTDDRATRSWESWVQCYSHWHSRQQQYFLADNVFRSELGGLPQYAISRCPR